MSFENLYSAYWVHWKKIPISMGQAMGHLYFQRKLSSNAALIDPCSVWTFYFKLVLVVSDIPIPDCNHVFIWAFFNTTCAGIRLNKYTFSSFNYFICLFLFVCLFIVFFCWIFCLFIFLFNILLKFLYLPCWFI